MMLRRIAKLFLLCVLGLAIAGCGKSGSSGSNSAHVRFMNAVVDAGPLNITVGTKSVVTGLAFEGLTTYQDTDSGTQEYKVSVAGGTSTIIDTSLSLSGDAQYTYVVYGTASAPTSVIVADASTDPGSGLFFLRVTNAAFGNAALDVYVTTPGAPLDNASPNISNILLGASSSFTQLTPGTLQVRMTLRNSKQVIYDAGTLTFNERTSYYMVAYTKGSSTLVNAALLNIDSTGSGSVVNSKIAQFKVIHAAPGTAAINAFVDGTVAFANVPYQGASSYSALAAGTHAVTFQTVTSPGAVIASAQPALAAATDTSIVVTGAPGAQTAVVLPDNNLPGTTGSARVRFVNVAPNLGPVDVYVNFAPRALALGSNAASGYVALVEDTYAINFDVAGTTTVVLNMPTVPFNAGHSYTIYLVGTTGQLAGVVTRDN
jgi:uncharacterized protein DUF4397